MNFRALFSIMACLFLISCGQEDSNGAPLRVMISPDNPPFEFKETASGSKRVIGFDVDLIKLIGKELGRKTKIIQIDFPGIIPGIQSQRADMAISALAATDERRKSVDFSIPYYTYSFAAVTKKDLTLESYKDLAHKKVGTQLGSTHEAKAHELSKTLRKLKVLSLNKVPELILELKNGRSHVVLTQEIVAKKIVAANPDLHFKLLDDIERESMVIVFPKGSPLVKEVNQAIENLRERGEIDRLINKWFTN